VLTVQRWGETTGPLARRAAGLIAGLVANEESPVVVAACQGNSLGSVQEVAQVKRATQYDNVRFTADNIKSAASRLADGLRDAVELKLGLASVTDDKTEWHHDSLSEWYGAYRDHPKNAYLSLSAVMPKEPLKDLRAMIVAVHGSVTNVTVAADDRGAIQGVFDVFESSKATAALPLPAPPPPPEPTPVTVFIGHGRNPEWRDIKDALVDKHGYRVEAYEVGARAGHTIRDILDEMMTKSSFALLVMTAEDETADGDMRARQNVIHEAGLFQGRLGFARAVAVVENGVEVLSNLDGVQQIRFPRGHVASAVGEILATLRREFGDRR
jgi:predicted nucleotide-binding protein